MKLHFLAICSLLSFLASCTSDDSFKERVGRALSEDPSLLSSTIENNPQMFVMSLQEIVATARVRHEEQEKIKREQEVESYLRRPLNPRRLANDVFRGNPNAPVTIVQYVDFECGFCARGQKVMKRLENRYGDQIRFQIRHMPSENNQVAMPAALAFEALKKQNGELAFQWYDKVFKEQSKLIRGEKFLYEQARLLGANMEQLQLDMQDEELQKRVNEDILEAEAFGFKGAPGYLVGGVPVRGAYPEETFIRLIEELGRRTRLGAR